MEILLVRILISLWCQTDGSIWVIHQFESDFLGPLILSLTDFSGPLILSLTDFLGPLILSLTDFSGPLI